MKRRSLIVGSALASVGALLGVGKVAEGNAPVTTAPSSMNIWDEGKVIQPSTPNVWEGLANSLDDHGHGMQEAQLAAIREHPWYQATLRRKVLEQMYPMYSLEPITEPSGLLPPLKADPAVTRALHRRPYPYFLKLPESGPGG